MNRTRSVAIAAVIAAGLGLAAAPAQAAVSGGAGGKSIGAEEAPDASFAASLNGANEVQEPGGPAAGDKDGSALAFMRIRGSVVEFAIQFSGIGAPNTATINEGVRGTNGPVRITLFTKQIPAAPPGSLIGKVTVRDAKLLERLRTNPGGFYFDLTTAQFPGGAVRAQVHGLTNNIEIDRALRQNFKASVIKGFQIYACTKQADGTFAFTQDNVRATLENDISHFFAQPGPAGPPEWLASDKSAVTGKVLARIPNGAGNIAELDLAATQVGAPRGILSGIDELLRLNTVGGLAPAGACDPRTQPSVAVPYRADYLFVDASVLPR